MLPQQVLSTLGNVKGLRVLELGAGIGRFTGELAKTGAQALFQHSSRSHAVLAATLLTATTGLGQQAY